MILTIVVKLGVEKTMCLKLGVFFVLFFGSYLLWTRFHLRLSIKAEKILITWKCKEANSKEVNLILFIGLLLGLAFLALYLGFRFQLGFSPGPDLESKDWLCFLSGYLTFAGSLIMTLLVYAQNKKINELIAREYEISFEAVPMGVAMKLDNMEEPTSVLKKIIYPKLRGTYDGESDKIESEPAQIVPFFYISLKNTGKLNIENLTFSQITVSPLEPNSSSTCTFKMAQPTFYTIQSKQTFRVCFALHGLPTSLPFSDFNLSFRYGEQNKDCTIHFWVLQDKNGLLFSDGVNNRIQG